MTTLYNAAGASRRTKPHTSSRPRTARSQHARPCRAARRETPVPADHAEVRQWARRLSARRPARRGGRRAVWMNVAGQVSQPAPRGRCCGIQRAPRGWAESYVLEWRGGTLVDVASTLRSCRARRSPPPARSVSASSTVALRGAAAAPPAPARSCGSSRTSQRSRRSSPTLSRAHVAQWPDPRHTHPPRIDLRQPGPRQPLCGRGVSTPAERRRAALA